MAAHITGARQAVAEVFNEIGRRTGGSLDDFKIVALGIDDRTEAFAQALVHTAQASVPAHRVFLTELAALGLIDLPKAFAALAAAIGEKGGSAKVLWAQDATGNVMEPQGWNAEIAKTLKNAELITALNYAARRICLIDTGQSQGTGFLIGPQTVLTNWHVMVPLLDPAKGKARPDSSGRIRCTFEALTSPSGQTYPAVDDWLVSFSPLDPISFATSRARFKVVRSLGFKDHGLRRQSAAVLNVEVEFGVAPHRLRQADEDTAAIGHA